MFFSNGYFFNFNDSARNQKYFKGGMNLFRRITTIFGYLILSVSHAINPSCGNYFNLFVNENRYLQYPI
jgi:hypothetical protein